MATFRERGGLLVDDYVLAAGCRRPVPVVDDEDLHRRPSPAGAASSEAATNRLEQVGRRVTEPGLGDRGHEAVGDQEQCRSAPDSARMGHRER